MLRFYKAQKVIRLGAACISLQKGRLTQQRKTRFITNVAATYYELQNRTPRNELSSSPRPFREGSSLFRLVLP